MESETFLKATFPKAAFPKVTFLKLCFSKVCFSKACFSKVYFFKVYFAKCIFPKSIFPKCIFPKSIYPKSIFAKCTRLVCLISFASLLDFYSAQEYHINMIRSLKSITFPASQNTDDDMLNNDLLLWRLPGRSCELYWHFISTSQRHINDVFSVSKRPQRNA